MKNMKLAVKFVKVKKNEPWPDYEDAHITFRPKYLHRTESNCPEWIKETLEIDDELFEESALILVIVRYYDGSTFGTTYGYWDIVKVTNDIKVASQLQKDITEKKGKNPKGYTPWDGFFGGFERVETEIVHMIGPKE